MYIIVLIAIVTRFLFHFIHPNGRETYALMIACLDSFGIGGLLAYWFIFDKAKLKSILDRNWVFVFSLLLFLCCCGTLYFYHDGNLIFRLFNRLSFSICCFWVIGVSCLQGFRGMVKLFLENKIVAYLGKISYGLYLYHNFVPSLCEFILKVLHIPVSLTERPIYESALIYFFITIMLSIISWHLIEKPFISLKKYFEYQFITIT